MKRYMKIPKGTPLYEYNYDIINRLDTATPTPAKRDLVVEFHYISPGYGHARNAPKMVSWSTRKQVALEKDVILDVPAPVRKEPVKSTVPTLRQRMVKGSKWKLTQPVDVMKQVPTVETRPDGSTYKWWGWVDYALPVGTEFTVTGKATQEWQLGLCVPIKLANGKEVRVVSNKFSKDTEQIGETVVEYQFVIWDKKEQKYYGGYDYNWDDRVVSNVGYNEKLTKAKKFKRLADVRVHCLIQSGYYDDLPESWGSVPEWMCGRKMFDIPDSWEIVKLNKFTKQEVERIELIDTFKRSWKLRALTVKYNSAVRAVYSDLEKKGKLGEYSAMMMFAKKRDDKYWDYELTDAEKRDVDALMKRYSGSEVKIQKTNTGFAVAVKDASTATMIYLSYVGDLKSVIIDFNTMEEVVAQKAWQSYTDLLHSIRSSILKEIHKMQFFKKLFQQIAGAANDGLDAASDNSRAVRQSVREMEEDIEKAVAAVADVNAQKALIINRINDAKAAAADWGQRAERAVKLNDDTLAAAALQEQVNEEGRTAKYQAQLDELTPQADKLNQLLATRREQLENAKIDSDVVQANDAVADATMAAAKSLSAAGSVGSFKASKDAIAKKSATANALLDLNEDPGAATERKLREMENKGNVGDRLAALKAKVTV